MRVIAGSAKGCGLESPKGHGTRPTADRVREALFSAIGDKIIGARFLDLFGGTGAVGIEALSRGAAYTVFTDISPVCIKIIEKNLNKTRLSDKSRLIAGDAAYVLERCLAGDRFDIIYLDPPYKKKLIDFSINTIVKNKIINLNGMVIAEYGSGENVYMASGVEIIKIKKYGNTRLVFYGYI